MLGAVVGNEDVNGATGGASDDLSRDRIVDRRYVRTADPTDIATVHTQREVVRPLRSRIRVAVEVGNELAPRLVQTLVTGNRQSAVRDRYQSSARVATSNLGSAIGGPVVDDEDLEAGIIELA